MDGPKKTQGNLGKSLGKSNRPSPPLGIMAQLGYIEKTMGWEWSDPLPPLWEFPPAVGPLECKIEVHH